MLIRCLSAPPWSTWASIHLSFQALLDHSIKAIGDRCYQHYSNVLLGYEVFKSLLVVQIKKGLQVSDSSAPPEPVSIYLR